MLHLNISFCTVFSQSQLRNYQFTENESPSTVLYPYYSQQEWQKHFSFDQVENSGTNVHVRGSCEHSISDKGQASTHICKSPHLRFSHHSHGKWITITACPLQ